MNIKNKYSTNPQIGRMPKTFSKQEKQAIRNALIERGKELFSTFGLKKTTVADLADAGGIAQGSFYHFFNSKEELYFDILEVEQAKSEHFLEEIVISSPSAKEAIREVIKGTFELFRTNPFIRRTYDSLDYELMLRKLPPERLQNHLITDTIRVKNIITRMQQKNELIHARPEVVAGLLRAIAILYFHQDDVGREIFPDVIDLLADIVASGLVNDK